MLIQLLFVKADTTFIILGDDQEILFMSGNVQTGIKRNEKGEPAFESIRAGQDGFDTLLHAIQCHNSIV